MKPKNLNCTSCDYCDEFDDGESGISFQCNKNPPVWTGKGWSQPDVSEIDWCGYHQYFKY